MIAIDTNILVHAHRRDSPHFATAREAVRSAAEARAPWAIPWPCIHEFFAKVTHPRIFGPPSTHEQALAQIDVWLASPTLSVLGARDEYWPTLASLVRAARIVGPQIHDARIAALCLVHGVSVLLTADRDFNRFPSLATRNPLVLP